MEYPPDPGTPSTTSLKILVVDDSEDSARMLALMLSLEGYEVQTSFSAAEALEAAERSGFDVVFLDIGLPLMDGFEVARRMRAIHGMRNALLVAMTGYGEEDDRRRASEAGFDHHVVKPADPAMVQDLLRNTAGRR